ncbi:hypothetical protein C9I98_10355 [Photobacterium sanctipauli]|uniref:Uncharacterized protein n=1 Tax=Photobacterium sanctipauli TaxID=1342794 RepID=A0A2T3NU85_9GAMM|nr:hypothetical protein [Photobacterium sanctipauli]PSW19856.1 hypothetical protein C9I98_10355 [Photobacterium sanctipauli]
MNTCHSIYHAVKEKGAHWKSDTPSAITKDVEKLILDLEPYTQDDSEASHLAFLLKDLLEVLSIDFSSAADQQSASMLLIDEITQASHLCEAA